MWGRSITFQDLVSARVYFAKVADIVITFEADEQGRSTSLVLQQSGVRTAAKRIE